jgi:hypothetical protein
MLAEVEVNDRTLSALDAIYPTGTPPPPVAAPRRVTADGYDESATPPDPLAERGKAFAVARTARVMGRLLGVSANQTSMSQLSTSAQMTVADDPSNNTGAGGQPAGPHEDESTMPLLVDGWGNPIIFVPKGGLSGVGVTDPTGGNPSQLRTVASPNNRPFWASAGPDGSFGVLPGKDGTYGTADDEPAGEDNLYSFDN